MNDILQGDDSWMIQRAKDSNFSIKQSSLRFICKRILFQNEFLISQLSIEQSVIGSNGKLLVVLKVINLHLRIDKGRRFDAMLGEDLWEMFTAKCDNSRNDSFVFLCQRYIFQLQ